jgi:hypothetical protein
VRAELSAYKNEINMKGSAGVFVVPALGSRIFSSYQLENMHDF